MSTSPTSPIRAPMLTVLLALAAVGLMAFAAIDTGWFVATSATGEYSVGLVAAQMCTGGVCRNASLSAFELSSQTPRLGVAVLLAVFLAGLLLFSATTRALFGSAKMAWLPKFALFGTLFAIALASAWLLLSPWSESMTPGLSSVLFFVGAALAAATAAVPLGALRRHSVL